MKVAVIGYGIDGQSAAKYWHGLGNEVTICDRAKGLIIEKNYKAQLGEDYLDNLDKFDLVVRSPGVHPDKLNTSQSVTTTMAEFFKKCPAPIIGITGTKGKSTTSSLIAHIINNAGQKAWLAGNIGVPVLDILGGIRPTDWVVVELSNFQLHDLTNSPNIAVLLRVGVDHLDYHSSLDEYINTKLTIFKYQKITDTAVFRGGDKFSEQAVKLSAAQNKISFSISDSVSANVHLKDSSIFYKSEKIVDTEKIKLLGRHNIENVCAAVATTYGIIKDPKKIAAAIESFKGLEHRLEKVGNAKGVVFIDDSIATNPDTTTAAIESFIQPKILILGGSDKGHNYDALAKNIAKSNVKYCVLIGAMARKISKSLQNTGYNDFSLALDMDEAVNVAYSQSKPGDVVLLSPACASFDMFTNYAQRGQVFTKAVKCLTN